jgi:membrane associated rhomboid family serine protease
MIPLRDDVPSRSVPIVNLTLIAVSVVAFIYELGLGRGLDGFFKHAAVVPVLFAGDDGRLSMVETVAWVLSPALGLRVIFSMFLHGGWLHLLGNMLYLWIFGDNVEDRMGHLRYLIFYLLCGGLATMAHVSAEPRSPVPSLGASGAIAGVLGAYLALYPRAQVVTLLPLGFFTQLIKVPAFFFLVFWFLQQFLYGTLSLTAKSVQTGGVAWWAHIGGFAAGLALVGLFQNPKRRPRARESWWGAGRARGRA